MNSRVVGVCEDIWDPHVMELVGSGSTQSPTVSQLGRVFSCQMIVSNGWTLQLGDIRGAFLEAGALDKKKTTTVLEFSSRENHKSTGWISYRNMTPPGHPSGSFGVRLMCVCGYTLGSTVENFKRILCVHVDDTFCGRSHFTAQTYLRHCFPFRKWQAETNIIYGSKYVQNKDDKEIMISPAEFAVAITRVPVSPARKK